MWLFSETQWQLSNKLWLVRMYCSTTYNLTTTDCWVVLLIVVVECPFFAIVWAVLARFAIVSAILEVVSWISVLPLTPFPCLFLEPLLPEDNGLESDLGFVEVELTGATDEVTPANAVDLLGGMGVIDGRVFWEVRLLMARALGNVVVSVCGICLGRAAAWARASEIAEVPRALTGWTDGCTRGCAVAEEGVTWVEVATWRWGGLAAGKDPIKGWVIMEGCRPM